MKNRMFNNLKRLALIGALLGVGWSAPGWANDEQPDPETERPKLPGIFPGRDLPLRPLPIEPGLRPGVEPGDDSGRRSGREGDSDGGSTSRSRPDSSSPPSSSTNSTASDRTGNDGESKPPKISGARSVDIDFNKTTIYDLVKFFAQITGKNFIITDESKLKTEVTIISHKKVSARAAYEAFLSALEVTGFTTVQVGNNVKIIDAAKGIQAPIKVSSDGSIPRTDQVITQLIPLENVSAQDLQSLVNTMKSPKGSVNAYLPSNTLIITDHAYNIRKIFQLVMELDVAAPKSRMEFVELTFAEAEDVKTIIEQLYGVAESSKASSDRSSPTRRTRDRRRRRRDADATPAAASVAAGKSAKYIDKVMSDERTNTLIVLANDEGHEAVRKLVAELDRDITDSSRSKIHVVRLEHAKAEDVTQVLESLANGSRSNSSSSRNSRSGTRNTRTNRMTPSSRGRTTPETSKKKGDGFGAVAAFEDGLRIASDDETNSLVIIASPEDFRVLKTVIDKLDQKRRQVFVDAVIVEITSDDNNSFNFGAHMPQDLGLEGGVGFLSGQMGSLKSALPSTDLLSGLALGVFGESIEFSGLQIPTFGIVLQALKTYSGFNVVSSPNILTLDNKEATITVGEKVPFPQASQFNSLTGTPSMTFTREDVAIELKLTPRVNSSNYVTLELVVEVAEVKPDTSGGDPLTSGGPVTTNRKVETHALVKDNQTVVVGGLMSNKDTEEESKIPILGDLPLVGALFRSKKTSSVKKNLLIFLTPHIVEDEADMTEIMRVKEAQFRAFRQMFYGRSKEEQMETMNELLQYSMNLVDRESVYRGKVDPSSVKRSGGAVEPEPGAAIREDLGRTGYNRGDSAAGPAASTETDVEAPDGEAPDAETPDVDETPANEGE